MVKYVLTNFERLLNKRPLFQNLQKRKRPEYGFAIKYGDKDLRVFFFYVLWSEERNIKLFDHKDHFYF